MVQNDNRDLDRARTVRETMWPWEWEGVQMPVGFMWSLLYISVTTTALSWFIVGGFPTAFEIRLFDRKHMFVFIFLKKKNNINVLCSLLPSPNTCQFKTGGGPGYDHWNISWHAGVSKVLWNILKMINTKTKSRTRLPTPHQTILQITHGFRLIYLPWQSTLDHQIRIQCCALKALVRMPSSLHILFLSQPLWSPMFIVKENWIK